LAMIVAEVLGVDLDRVHVQRVDSDVSPIDLGSYSSRVTFMMGNAARTAALDLKAQIARGAAALLDCPADDVEVGHEQIRARGRPGASVPFLEALHRAMEGTGALTASGSYQTRPVGGSFKGARAGTAPAYSFAAYVAETTVDVDTGEYSVDKVWAAFDCGRPLNRLAVEGQIEGSIHMGLGQVMGESMNYRGARLLNPSLLEYKIPAPQQMPEVEVLLVGDDDPEGPFGAKEAGEGPLVATLPAVANALYDAIGCRFTELPITPDRVVRALERRRHEGRPWKGA
ncbi:MAG TPA: molybdopterin cofactor-binding domain-containing protein, partial [Thermoplasmata archaeon]|nr:molybdopterin cofactor-binding domain-containing protein [Thermoplasmata archaeon]